MAMGAYSFTIFIVFLVVFGIYIWKKLPETKNKTYEELYREFKIENPDICGSRLSLNKPMVRQTFQRTNYDSSRSRFVKNRWNS